VVEVRLFGELEAVQDGVAVPVRGTKQRALLALLALHRGEPVSADRLIDVLWGDGQAANPGDGARQYSIRINRQVRICFSWSDAGPEDVEIVDCH
jgi:DNA-binding SARP family transcriptional activator